VYQQQQLTRLSQNKCAPKWSFGGRRNGGSRPGTPGPGAYAAERGGGTGGKISPAYGFGTSARDPSEIRAAQAAAPGPGQYKPVARPRSATPNYSFGSSNQRGALSNSGTPGPGSYVPNVGPTKGAVPQYTATPRREAGRLAMGHMATPGPGSYQADGRADVEKSPAWGFGTSMRENNNCEYSPGPGAYSGNANRQGPAYTMRSRWDGGRHDDTPGPGAHGGMHTQFGY